MITFNSVLRNAVLLLMMVVCAFSSDAAYAQIQCPDGIISNWKLDETSGTTYTDTYGGIDGSCAGDCPVPDLDGRINVSQIFNGVTTGINVTSSGLFNWDQSTSFTIEYWVKRASGALSADEVVLGRSDASTGMMWWAGIKDTGEAAFRLIAKNGDGSDVSALLTGTTQLNDGTWHHVVVMRDTLSGRNILYVDGKVEDGAYVTYTDGFDSASAPINMGWLDSGGGNHFNGELDEVAMYGRALSDIEILQHYNDGLVGLRLGVCSCNDQVAIMPLGDSITEGQNPVITDNNYRVGYRAPLFWDLTGAGYYFDFVGSKQAGMLADPGIDFDHEGHGGWSDGAIAGSVSGFLLNNHADVVLLHIGTNALSSSPDDVEDILNNIDAYSEDTVVVLARIINRKTYSSLTTTFNDNVEAMAMNRIANGDRIILVDQESALVYPDDMEDNLHPNTYGYNKMPAAWYDGLDDFLPVCSSVAPYAPAIVSQPVTTSVRSVLYSYDVDALADPAPTYTLVQGPAGMTINEDTGVIDWTATAIGDYDVSVMAVNSEGTDTQNFTINVTELLYVEIEGPLTITKNSSMDYECRAYYSDGSNKLVEADLWSEDSIYADITSTGVLNSGEVSTDEAVRISASYTEGAVTANAILDITILNVDPPSEVIIDDGDAGTTAIGNWASSSGPNPYGSGSLYEAGSGSYSYETNVSGQTDVSLWWTELPNRCSNVPVDIYDGAALLDTVYVNQQSSGGQWNHLGTYNFSGTAKVVIQSVGGCTTSADAVRFNESVLLSVEIEGPLTVNMNSSTDYELRAYYSNGTNSLVEADVWSENSPNADIMATGLLNAGEVSIDEAVRISASYTEGAVTSNAILDITILNVAPPSEVIIDDGDAGTTAVGNWRTSGGLNPYGTQSLFETGVGSYTFEASVSGPQDVSMWWTEYSNRCSSVQVEIYDGAALLDTVYVNNQVNGGQWNLLGTYNFSGIAKVVIVSGSGCTTSADAVKFAESAPLELLYVEIEGSLTVNKNSSSDYECRAYYSNGTNRLVEADVWSENSPNADITITGLLNAGEVSADEAVRISASFTEGAVTSNAILDITILNVEPPSEVIIDDGDAGTTAVGNWRSSGGLNPYGTGSLFETGNGSYTFEANVSGPQDVSMWWTEYSNRCTSVQVEIYDGASLLDTVYVNNQVNGGQWNLLGTYNFSGTASVVIVSGSGCTTSADAVKFEESVPADLLYVEIEGPLTVNKNSSADYECRAYYSNGTNMLVEADVWSENSPNADITITGLLNAGEVSADEAVRISASYTEGAVTSNAILDITILNVDPPSEVIVDDGDAGTTAVGNWRSSGGLNPYGTGSLFDNGTGSYSYDLNVSGQQDVYLWWTEYANRCTSVPVEIYDGATLLDTIYVNNQVNGGQWNLLGTYSFSGTAKVTIVSVGGCTTSADAVRFLN